MDCDKNLNQIFEWDEGEKSWTSTDHWNQRKQLSITKESASGYVISPGGL